LSNHYSFFNAIICEIAIQLKHSFPRYDKTGWLSRLIEYCFDDWVLWSTERSMKNVDKQVDKIQEQWNEEDRSQNPIIIEHKPDGSKAQELLGGTMEIKSPWTE